MADYSNTKNGQSIRTVLQGLILAGIVGLVTMVIHQGRESAQADTDRRVQIATLQAQVASLQTMLAGLPDLSQRMTRLEVNQTELMRRQSIDDLRWEKLDTKR